MFSMLGKIFSSSQPQPVKENRSPNSDSPSLSNIDENDANGNQMGYRESRNGEGGEDINGSLRGADGATDPEVSKDDGETIQPTQKSEKKSRTKKRKGKEPAEIRNKVAYPELAEIIEDDAANDAPEKKDIEELPADAAKKDRKSKRVNGTSKKRTRANAQISEAEPAPILPGDDAEEEDLVALLHKSRIRKSKLEITNPRRSKRIASAEPETSIAATRSRQSSVESTVLLSRTKVAKAKAQPAALKSRRNIYDISEDEAVTTVLHQSIAPASPTQHPARTYRGSRSKKYAPAQTPTMEEDEENDLPKNPSQKALGKRKAPDASSESSKKRRRKNENVAAGMPPLSSYGFLSDDSARSDRAGPNSIPNPSIQALASTAQRLYAEAESDPENLPIPFSKPVDFPSSQPIQSPQWTAVNSPDQLRSAQNARPNSSSAKLSVVINAHLTSPSPSPEIDPLPPKSSEKRKRRIPTGEPESTKSTKLINPRGRKAVSRMPNLEKSTPRPRANSTARSTPAAKGSRVLNGDFDIIFKAVEMWRENNDMTQFELNNLIQRAVDAESKKFWDYMAEEIPDIPRKKMQQTCRRNFHNFEARGSWTEEQDEELRRHYEAAPGKWKQIGELLNRFSEDCRDRWRNYVVCGDKQRKDAWDKEEEENLRVAVAECIEMIREQANKSQNSLVDSESLLDWKKVSEKMGYTRSRLQCLTKWKGLKQRVESDVEDFVAEAPVSETPWRLEEAESQAQRMTAKQKLDLLYAIRDSAAGSEGKIPWVIIQKDDLHVKGKRMALRVCYRTLKQHIEGHEDMKLQEIIDNLIDAYEEAAPNEPKGFNKSFRSSQRSILSRRSKTPQSSKREKRKERDLAIEYSDDNGEGPSTVKKSRLSRKMESEPVDMETPRPSKPKPKVKAKTRINGNVNGKKSDMIEEMENENVLSSAPQPKKKKLRDRMKPIQDEASQESVDENQTVATSDDLENVLGAMKTGKARTPARHGGTGRRNLKLSDEYVHESEEDVQEEQPVVVEEEEEEKEEEGAVIHEPRKEIESASSSQGEDTDAIDGSQAEDEDASQAINEDPDIAEESQSDSQSEVESVTHISGEDQDMVNGSLPQSKPQQALHDQDIVEESQSDFESQSGGEDQEMAEESQSSDEEESEIAEDEDIVKEALLEDESQVSTNDENIAETSTSEHDSEPNSVLEIEESQPEVDDYYDDFHQDINGDNGYTVAGGPDQDMELSADEIESLAYSEDKKPTPTRHPKASVDLDAEEDEHRIIMTGWGKSEFPVSNHEDDESEEDDDDEEDDDEEEEERGRSPSKRLASPITFLDQNNTPRRKTHTNGYANGHSKSSRRDRSVSSDDSSMSDIPSVPKWKLSQVQARDSSAEL